MEAPSNAGHEMVAPFGKKVRALFSQFGNINMLYSK
jgi:hypothetical protein